MNDKYIKKGLLLSNNGKRMKRSDMRKHVFLMLFRKEFHDTSELELQDKLYFEDFENLQVLESDRDVISARVADIREHLDNIDSRISEISEGWTIDRLGKVELTILRLAVYEIVYDNDIPISVAINEAVELSKEFGGDSSPAFINAVLAKVEA